MIDTESVSCDTCTAPAPGMIDASDEASRAWPRVDIDANPYKEAFPLFAERPHIALLRSAPPPPPQHPSPACSHRRSKASAFLRDP